MLIPTSELFSQAMDLVVYGMGTVFVFLTVLVFMTMLMSALIGTSTQVKPSIGPTSDQNSQDLDPKLLAAITAAVKRHRHSKQ